jgi:hypothetical protein
MTASRSTVALSVVLVLAFVAAATHAAAGTSAPPGYVDASVFRALVDENQDVVEINLEGPILKAMAKKGREGHDADDTNDLFAKLESIHAVIGTVKGPAQDALALVQKTDRRLAAAGWQRIARISAETSTISVLTHTVADKIDGLVVLTFDSSDKALVFANLAGEIDITKLGEIGERFDVPGLDQVPGAH